MGIRARAAGGRTGRSGETDGGQMPASGSGAWLERRLGSGRRKHLRAHVTSPSSEYDASSHCFFSSRCCSAALAARDSHPESTRVSGSQGWTLVFLKTFPGMNLTRGRGRDPAWKTSPSSSQQGSCSRVTLAQGFSTPPVLTFWVTCGGAVV